MQRDNECILGTAQAVTSAAVISTNVLKFKGDAVKNPFWVVRIPTAFVAAESPATPGTVVKYELQTATDAAFTSPVSLASKDVAIAALTKNAEVVSNPIPYGSLGYLRVKATPTGEFTAGAFSSEIVVQPDMGKN